MPDIYFVLAAFLVSMAGDWFLSNKGLSFPMFSWEPPLAFHSLLQSSGVTSQVSVSFFFQIPS